MSDTFDEYKATDKVDKGWDNIVWIVDICWILKKFNYHNSIFDCFKQNTQNGPIHWEYYFGIMGEGRLSNSVGDITIFCLLCILNIKILPYGKLPNKRLYILSDRKQNLPQIFKWHWSQVWAAPLTLTGFGWIVMLSLNLTKHN